MIILALCVFAFSSWAVFSHKFDDGILAKNFLVFAAIFSFLVILDPWNKLAAYVSLGLLAIGLLLWYYRTYRPLMISRTSQKERQQYR